MFTSQKKKRKTYSFLHFWVSRGRFTTLEWLFIKIYDQKIASTQQHSFVSKSLEIVRFWNKIIRRRTIWDISTLQNT